MRVPFLGPRGLGRSRRYSRKLGGVRELGGLRELRSRRELGKLTGPLMRCPMELEGLIAPPMECPTKLEVRLQLCLPQVGVTRRVGKWRYPLVGEVQVALPQALGRLPALMECPRAVERLPDLMELPRAVER